MGKIYRSHYWTLHGKRVRKGTRGAIKKTLPNWYGILRLASGRRKQVALVADRDISRQILTKEQAEQDGIARGVEPPKGQPRRVPLAELIPAWEAYLKSKDNTAKHVRYQKAQIEEMAAQFHWHEPSDLAADTLSRELKARRDEKRIGVTTSNYYLRTWKGFARWLVDREYLNRNPFASLKPVPSNPLRKRRAISPKDFERLIAAASKSKRTYRRLGGKDRALLYQVAAATGLRVRELASLTRDSLHGDKLVLPPASTKNRQGASQPLPKALADVLRKRKGKLFPGSWWWDSCRMLQVDLTAAGIPYRDAQGRVFDFHSWRLFYITGLARAGVPLQLAQKLARHSSPNLTSTVYTQWEEEELRKAVEKAHG